MLCDIPTILRTMSMIDDRWTRMRRSHPPIYRLLNSLILGRCKSYMPEIEVDDAKSLLLLRAIQDRRDALWLPVWCT